MIKNLYLKDKYYNTEKLTEKDYENGRNYFLLEGSSAITILSLTTGAFIAGFCSYLGVSDSINGIILSIPVLTASIQFFSSLIFNHLDHKKLLISIIGFFARFLLGLLFFVPIIIKNENLSLILFISIYTTAYSLAAIIGPAVSSLLIDLTPQNIRGRYIAQKEAIQLGISTIITLGLGQLLDVFKEQNKELTAFFIIGIIIILCAFINFYAISSMKEPIASTKQKNLCLKESVFLPFRYKPFRKIIYFNALWNIALQIGGPFFAIYSVTGLKLSYFYMMVIGLLSSVIRIYSSKYWGRLCDSRSCTFALKYSLVLLAICHFIWTFIDGTTYSVLYPLVNIIGGIAWAGLVITIFNIQFDYAPIEGRMSCLGINATVGGIIGFISSLIGSILVGFIGENKIALGDFTISSMQMLFGISAILLFITAFFVHKFIHPKEEKTAES